MKSTLQKIFDRLFETFGPQHWWPAETPFEVMVGAILTQNTNWGNVEKAILNLKQNHSLTPEALQSISLTQLALLIRPAGYFNIKARRLKNFIQFLFEEYGGNLRKIRQESLEGLRKKLLQVNGIGPETADSILLYAVDKPVFVVDAYTQRILYRHNLIAKEASYETLQSLFMGSLKKDVTMFNEYHALIVRLGKDFCKTKPLCEGCPLRNIHYSLVYKCHGCHRALFKKRERRQIKENSLRKNIFLCQSCLKKEKDC